MKLKFFIKYFIILNQIHLDYLLYLLKIRFIYFINQNFGINLKINLKIHLRIHFINLIKIHQKSYFQNHQSYRLFIHYLM